MNKLRVILTFIHQSSIAKWMFIVRKKNKLSQDWIFITVRIHPMSAIAIKGELITKLYMNWPEKITYDLSICYPYKHDCYSMCDLKSTQWSAVMSLKASTSNEQLHRLISILRLWRGQ